MENVFRTKLLENRNVLRGKKNIRMYLGDKQILFHEINKTVFENGKQTKTNDQEIKETNKKKRNICVFGIAVS